MKPKKKTLSITRKIGTVQPGETVGLPVAPAPKCLSPKDLMELQLRSQQVQHITHQKLMIEEAYQQRVASTLHTYGCAGKFEIDMRTGEITPKKESNA